METKTYRVRKVPSCIAGSLQPGDSVPAVLLQGGLDPALPVLQLQSGAESGVPALLLRPTGALEAVLDQTGLRGVVETSLVDGTGALKPEEYRTGAMKIGEYIEPEQWNQENIEPEQ